MTKKKKKDVFNFEGEDFNLDLIVSRLERNEKSLKKQEQITNNHLELFQETLSSLSKDYEEIKKIKKQIRFLYWSIGIVGLVSFSVFIFISYFVLSFIF